MCPVPSYLQVLGRIILTSHKEKIGLENKKGWGGEEGHLEYGYGMGCDVRDVAQRNRVIVNSLE